MASIQELEVSVCRVASIKLIRLKQCAAIVFSSFFGKTSSSSKRSKSWLPIAVNLHFSPTFLQCDSDSCFCSAKVDSRSKKQRFCFFYFLLPPRRAQSLRVIIQFAGTLIHSSLLHHLIVHSECL